MYTLRLSGLSVCFGPGIADGKFLVQPHALGFGDLFSIVEFLQMWQIAYGKPSANVRADLSDGSINRDLSERRADCK
jgi:hypothetical protein